MKKAAREPWLKRCIAEKTILCTLCRFVGTDWDYNEIGDHLVSFLICEHPLEAICETDLCSVNYLNATDCWGFRPKTAKCHPLKGVM